MSGASSGSSCLSKAWKVCASTSSELLPTKTCARVRPKRRIEPHPAGHFVRAQPFCIVIGHRIGHGIECACLRLAHAQFAIIIDIDPVFRCVWRIVVGFQPELVGPAVHCEFRARIGDAPVYLSYDIDSLDPAFAPGTGTVEPGGLTIWQGLEIVRGCAGLNLVGGDLVEVSPPYDPSGNTALIGANLLYEMLCVLPGVPQGKHIG